ncbi:MAG: hypothetical protein MRJ93_05160 [Nitrososphaeraceae archaeon]|nr:hypothetical protein [Nitrososphaeraceae archaeon]
MDTKKSKLKEALIIASIIIAAIFTTTAFSKNTSQTLEYVFAEKYSSGSTTMPSASNVTIFKTITPDQTTDKEFWINTVHFDGLTNINPGVKCDTCPQNTPIHPAEQPPINSTIPTGGGFRVTEPNKIGAWDFRSFTFSPSQIIVNQGDKVTLHFIGVQGAHHEISVGKLEPFTLQRGMIHDVKFIANSPGIINYVCHVHLPNMVGQILVLPKDNM